MQLKFLGVRGSTASPGADFVRYGGHTACIAVRGSDDPVPDLAFDAGTGLRAMTELVGGGPYRGAILLSHLHWDHVQGLPFFVAGDRDDAQVRVVLPAQDGLSGRDLLAQSMSPPAFPITPDGLRGSWTFDAVEPGQLHVGRYAVGVCEVLHKGGRTYAYRVERDGASVVYLPDHAPAGGVSAATRELLSGVDVLVHDAQFLTAERPVASSFGHSTVRDAVELAAAVGARTLVLFHHGPARTDAELDRIEVELDGAADRVGDLHVVVAREGATLEVVPGSASQVRSRQEDLP